MTLEVFSFTQLDDISLNALKQHSNAIKTTLLQHTNNFAKNCNLAAKNSNADWLLFFAPNVSIDKKTISAILNVKIATENATPEQALFAVRQLPLDMSWHINPISMEIESFEPEAFAVRKSAFLNCGGFDDNFSVYLCYELALRLRANKHKLFYLPTASVNVSQTHDRLAQPTLTDYMAILSEKVYLAGKYGNISKIAKAKTKYFTAIKHPKHYAGVRKALLKNIAKLTIKGFKCFGKSFTKTAYKKAVNNLGEINPDTIPQRGREAQFEITQNPLVSVIVRTCNRPAVLRETLKSLRWQTYKNFEIVLIEDGPPTAETMVKAEFSDLPIRYHSTGKNIGRGKAGNLGIEHAKGEFVCFVDDDDFYYPDFIEASLAYLLNNPQADFLYNASMVIETNVETQNPEYNYTISKIEPVRFEHITLMDMCIKCRVPLNSAMFKRELYTKTSGMREDIDGDEDWAMWLRYTMVGKRKAQNALDIKRALSLFATPATTSTANARLDTYEKFDYIMLSDHDLNFKVTPYEITHWRTQLLADLSHLKALGKLNALLQDPKRNNWPRFTPVLPTDASEIVEISALQINGYYQTILDDVANGKITL